MNSEDMANVVGDVAEKPIKIFQHGPCLGFLIPVSAMSKRFEPSSIQNKIKREEVAGKNKKAKNQQKLQKRLAQAKLEANDPSLKKKRLAENVPHTLDNMREFDPSALTADPSTSGTSQEEELAHDLSNDPFADYFSSEADPTLPPKILITTSSKASKATYDFCDELIGVFPGAEFKRRKKGKGFEMGRIAGWAADRGYKHMCVVNEDMKKPNAITLIHLPNGPSAYFKLTSIELTKQIFGHARATPHFPETHLQGFVTRLGHAVGRMFQTTFPQLPEFQGRQLVTFHNQRDFIFFRRHRYAFRSPEKVALQEIGPRFTLKLRWMKKGIPAVHNYGESVPSTATDSSMEDDEKACTSSTALQGAEDMEHAELDMPTGPIQKTKTIPPKQDEYIWQWKSITSLPIFQTVRLLDLDFSTYFALSYTFMLNMIPSSDNVCPMFFHISINFYEQHIPIIPATRKHVGQMLGLIVPHVYLRLLLSTDHEFRESEANYQRDSPRVTSQDIKMYRRHTTALLLLLSVVGLVSAAKRVPNATSSTVNYWFSFGDSYTQTGFKPGDTAPNPANPLGNPTFPGYTATGGANWVGYLTSTYNKSVLYTYNYAYGGATIDAGLVTPYQPTVLSLTDQVKQFLDGKLTGWKSENSLFSIWIGINDIGNSWYKEGDRGAFSDTLLNAEFALVQKLYNVGARNFLFVNVPPIDRSPLMLRESTSSQAAEKLVIEDFNSRLAAKVQALDTSEGVTVATWIWDSNAQFTKILNAPHEYGFSNATAYGPGTDIFWGNDYHPSTYAHKFFAQDVAKILKDTVW